MAKAFEWPVSAAVFAASVVAVSATACGHNPVEPSQAAFAVTSVSPVSGSDIVPTAVRIYGRGFSADVVVQIDGVVTPAVIQSATEIDVTMPLHAAGFVDVTVTNAAHATSTLPRAFRYDHVDALQVSSLSPGTGSVEALNIVTVSGLGFRPDTSVSIDGVAAPDPGYSPAGYGSTRSSTLLTVWAQPHAPGTVDVVVRNSDGQTFRIPGGYTYAPAETFDFNGVWKGFTWETVLPVKLTIQNNLLVSVTCGTTSRTFSPPVAVTPGRLSFDGPDVSISGQVVSPTEASGLLSIPGCISSWGWQAFR